MKYCYYKDMRLRVLSQSPYTVTCVYDSKFNKLTGNNILYTFSKDTVLTVKDYYKQKFIKFIKGLDK